MRVLRSVLPFLILVLPLLAQSPPERIQAGFKTLSTGSWESALKAWARDGVWVDGDGRLQAKLEGQTSTPRSVGRWDAANLPVVTAAWQRHWMVATFDQGACFFVLRDGSCWRMDSSGG